MFNRIFLLGCSGGLRPPGVGQNGAHRAPLQCQQPFSRCCPPLPATAVSLPSTVPVLLETVPLLLATMPPLAPTLPPLAPTVPPLAPTLPPLAPTIPPLAPTEPPLAPTLPPLALTVPPLAPTVPPLGTQFLRNRLKTRELARKCGIMHLTNNSLLQEGNGLNPSLHRRPSGSPFSLAAWKRAFAFSSPAAALSASPGATLLAAARSIAAAARASFCSWQNYISTPLSIHQGFLPTTILITSLVSSLSCHAGNGPNGGDGTPRHLQASLKATIKAPTALFVFENSDSGGGFFKKIAIWPVPAPNLDVIGRPGKSPLFPKKITPFTLTKSTASCSSAGLGPATSQLTDLSPIAILSANPYDSSSPFSYRISVFIFGLPINSAASTCGATKYPRSCLNISSVSFLWRSSSTLWSALMASIISIHNPATSKNPKNILTHSKNVGLRFQSQTISPNTAKATITIPGCSEQKNLHDPETESEMINKRIAADNMAIAVLEICAAALLIFAVAKFFTISNRLDK